MTREIYSDHAPQRRRFGLAALLTDKELDELERQAREGELDGPEWDE